MQVVHCRLSMQGRKEGGAGGSPVRRSGAKLGPGCSLQGIQVSHITEGYAGVTIRKTETLVDST